MYCENISFNTGPILVDFECNPRMDNDNFFLHFVQGFHFIGEGYNWNLQKENWLPWIPTNLQYVLLFTLFTACSLEMSYAIHIHLIYDSFLHRIFTSTKVYLNLNFNIDYLQSYKIAILDRNSLRDGHRVPNFPVSVYKNCKSICTMINIFMISSLLNSTCNKRRHLVTIFKIIIEQVCKNIVEE